MINVKTVAFTGNKDIRFSDLKEKLDAIRKLYPDAVWISSGSIGTELIAAMYAMLNKIPLFMYIPYPPEKMTSGWLKGWQHIFEKTLKYAERVSVVSDVVSFEGYQECNERIADSADVVINFNRSISGDIVGCIRYTRLVDAHTADDFLLNILKAPEIRVGLCAPAHGAITANTVPCES